MASRSSVAAPFLWTHFALSCRTCATKPPKATGSRPTVALANYAARPSVVTLNGLRTLRFGAFGLGGSTGGRSRAVLQRVGNGPADDRRFVDTRPERWIIRIARFTPLAVRNDDAARPTPESRRSGPTPAAGSAVALDCPSPMPSACDSDDNIPEILEGGGTGFAR